MENINVPFSDWKNLTNEVMTSLFRYGTSKVPQDLNDRVKDPSRSVTVTLDAVNFMSSGPGTYANPSQVPFVQTLFNPILLAPPGAGHAGLRRNSPRHAQCAGVSAVTGNQSIPRIGQGTVTAACPVLDQREYQFDRDCPP